MLTHIISLSEIKNGKQSNDSMSKVKCSVISAIVYKDSGQFHCSICDRGFNQRSNALTHYKNIHINVRKQCPYCLISVKKLKSHIRDVHTPKNIVNCKVCGKTYKEGRLLKDHMTKVHCLDGEGNTLEKYSERVPCRLCGQDVQKMRLARHLKEKHYMAESQFDCPLCSSQVKFLNWHLRSYHKYDKKLYKCHRCENLFLNKVNLEEHLSSHEQYACEDCGENFEKFLDFAAHLDISHGRFGALQTEDQSSLVTKYYITREEEPKDNDQEEMQEVSQESVTILVDVSGNIIENIEETVQSEENKVGEDEVLLPAKEVDGVKLFDIIIPTNNPKELQYDVEKLEPRPVLSQKLSERFRKEEEEVPRDLRNVKLSEEDEELLGRCPEPENLILGELGKYQIQSKAGKMKTRYESCPSRQAHLCPYCRQILKSKYALSSHIAVIHLKHKPLSCHLCDKSFATKADLVKHNQALHDEGRNDLVQCEDCGEQVRKPCLNRHRSYRHSKNTLPKICDKCGKDFKSRETMLKHVRKIHGNTNDT